MRSSSRLAPRRPAFTLVEMIVVLAIVLALAALAVALAPRMLERQKTQRAAEQIQGAFGIARQWARRAHAPTGIRLLPGRLLPNPVAPIQYYVTELQYIQQPSDFTVQPGLNLNAIDAAHPDPVNVRRIRVTPNGGVNNKVELEPLVQALPPGSPIPADFSGSQGMVNDSNRYRPASPIFGLWPVQMGDYLEVNGGGLMHRILIDPTYNPPSQPFTTTFTSTNGRRLLPGSPLFECDTFFVEPPGFPNAIGYTKEYRIVRRPRILPGEATLQIAQDVAIDLTKSRQLPTANPDGSIDIVFNSSGDVSVAGAADKVILWVRDITRDITQDANTPGDETLITISVRTGKVAAYEVAPLPDRYLFTKDGRSSGL